jgi:murein DD-endopeptidase MepM/ murein hydrolase activator NlpD
MKWALKGLEPKIAEKDGVGDFSFRRSFYHHPGIDLYCGFGQEIVAFESGIVVNIEEFTGPDANPPSPWWNPTRSVMIEGNSGVLGYCEILPLPHVKVGTHIEEGEFIAMVVPVLKKDKGNGITMLHFEQYTPGTRNHVTWVLDEEKPEELMNPRQFLEKVVKEVSK